MSFDVEGMSAKGATGGSNPRPVGKEQAVAIDPIIKSAREFCTKWIQDINTAIDSEASLSAVNLGALSELSLAHQNFPQVFAGVTGLDRCLQVFTEHSDSVVQRVSFSDVVKKIDRHSVIQNPNCFRLNCILRGHDPKIIDSILEYEADRRRVVGEESGYQTQINEAGKGLSIDEIKSEAHRAKIRVIKQAKDESGTQLKNLSLLIEDKLDHIPNITATTVPLGGEVANRILREVGQKPDFDFKPVEHKDLGENLGILDFQNATKMSGTGFYILRGDFARMRFALVGMLSEHLFDAGFEATSPPIAVRPSTLRGTGYSPFNDAESFTITGRDLALVGTSEQSLVAQWQDSIIDPKKLPTRFYADTQCFRTEMGGAGKLTRGMLRVHQFGKVEMIAYCKPEDSEAMHLEMLGHQEWLLKQLKIPYRVVEIASGDMGAPGMKKYDIEGWFPALNQYVELTSNTNLGSFQTARLGTRYKEGGNMVNPHTISATGFSDRLLACILENNQNADGSIRVPEVLRSKMSNLELITKKI